jgi:hypothetical protein
MGRIFPDASMKRIVCAIVLGFTGFAASAQTLSDQDINLMTASAKAVKVYQQNGISGVYSEVSQCYGHLHQGQKALGRGVEFCVALDISGIFIDSGVASAEGFPRDPRFKDAAAANRMNEVLRRYGITASDDDTRAYFAARVERIRKYTNDAMRLG